MDDNLQYLYDCLYELSGRLQTIEASVGALLAATGNENQVCDAITSLSNDDLVWPGMPISEDERARRVRLALNGLTEAVCNMFADDSHTGWCHTTLESF